MVLFQRIEGGGDQRQDLQFVGTGSQGDDLQCSLIQREVQLPADVLLVRVAQGRPATYGQCLAVFAIPFAALGFAMKEFVRTYFRTKNGVVEGFTILIRQFLIIGSDSCTSTAADSLPL